MHTWLAVKPSGAPRYTRYEVVGFGVANGAPSVRVDRMGPDNYWFGARPELLLDRRGPDADSIIEKIRAAVASYPYPHAYRAWPGPNSNTFTAHVARQVPELGLGLPANAIGKDFLPGGALVARAPSGTGVQLSLYGITGILVAATEGVELNVLGLSIGIDAAAPGLKLPAIGRLAGFADADRRDLFRCAVRSRRLRQASRNAPIISRSRFSSPASASGIAKSIAVVTAA